MGKGVEMYTWGGNGNFGDDWIRQIGLERLKELDVKMVSFKKRKNVFKKDQLDSYDFGAPIQHSESRKPLILWGGGYLATDQNTTTLEAWKSILDRNKRKIFTFGLGVGPFRNGTESLAHDVFSRMEIPINVRTIRDREILLNLGVAAELSCDVTLLDRGIRDNWNLEKKERRDNLVWLPPYANHWSAYATLEEYLEQILLAHRHNSITSVNFLDYSTLGFNPLVNSDYKYWKDFFPKRITATTFRDVLEALASAKHFVSGRLHPSLLALLLDTPVLALPYHHKFDLIFEIATVTTGQSIDSSVDTMSLNRSALQEVIARGNKSLEKMLEGVCHDV